MKALLIGVGSGLLVTVTTDFHYYDWQWYALSVPIILLANLAFKERA